MMQINLGNLIKLAVGIFLWLMASSALAAGQLQWQPLKPGLYFSKLPISNEYAMGNIYAFRFNLKKYRLQSVLAKQQGSQLASVKQLVLANHALLGINGGFFSPHGKILGLRINQGKVLNPLRAISWWSVFYIRQQHAYIVTRSRFRYQKNIEFAVQSGPRLVINGKIPSTLKNKLANRSAIGITRSGDLILLVTQHAFISTQKLAQIMQASPTNGGFNCINAINLDGGSSSQLYADLPSLQLHIPGFAKVADAILLLPR